MAGYFAVLHKTLAVRVRINLSDLLLEIISIVIAILLALAVNNWQENRKHHELLIQSLRNIRQELADNARATNGERAHHARVYRGFERLLVSAGKKQSITYDQIRSAFVRTSPTGFHNLLLQNIAWRIAQSDGSVAYMDYATRTELTRLYDLQDAVKPTEQQALNTLLATPPAGNNFYYSTTAAVSFLGDVVATEAALQSRYSQISKLLARDLGAVSYP